MDSQDKRIIADVEYDKIKKAEEEYKAISREMKYKHKPELLIYATDLILNRK